MVSYWCVRQPYLKLRDIDKTKCPQEAKAVYAYDTITILDTIFENKVHIHKTHTCINKMVGKNNVSIQRHVHILQVYAP